MANSHLLVSINYNPFPKNLYVQQPYHNWLQKLYSGKSRKLLLTSSYVYRVSQSYYPFKEKFPYFSRLSTKFMLTIGLRTSLKFCSLVTINKKDTFTEGMTDVNIAKSMYFSASISNSSG